jgi:adenylyltransferase/sulfurtransferase
MIHTLLIPTPLRPYTGRRDTVDVEGGTVGEMLADLASKYDGVRAHLFGSTVVRNFVNVYVNDEDIRFLQREATPVGAGDTVSIIPSVAGGAGVEAQVEALPGLSREEVFRYSRHLLIPEVGLEGQRKLKAARVLCIGAGGLGSPVAMYLAAAGVGTIGIVDFDTVDFSNLQRQLLH